MPFYKGRGGSIYEMDPPNPKLIHLAELRAEKIAKGDLVEIPADRVERVEEVYGKDKEGRELVAYRWIQKPAPADEPATTEPAPKVKAPKATPAPE